MSNVSTSNTSEKETKTPQDQEQLLLEAAWEGNEAKVKQLLLGLEDVSAALLSSVLLIAAKCGYMSLFDAVEAHGASLADFVRDADPEGRTALFFAAQEGHVDVAKWLIEKGASVHAADAEGWTALFVAAEEGHVAVAKWLIENGASVHVVGNNGGTPLFLAAKRGHVDVARLLIDNGAHADAPVGNGGWTPLYIAAGNGHLEVVKLLLYDNASVDHATSRGRTPLGNACFYGREAAVRTLLTFGADASLVSEYARESAVAKNPSGFTVHLLDCDPAHWAREGQRLFCQDAASVGIGLASLDLPVLVVKEIFEWLSFPRNRPPPAILWATLRLCKDRAHEHLENSL